MADQTRKPKPKKEDQAAQASESTATEEKGEELDDLLDEIDEVLESNAEDFVRSYVQKGGQAIVAGPLFMTYQFETWLLVAMMALAFLAWSRRNSFCR